MYGHKTGLVKFQELKMKLLPLLLGSPEELQSALQITALLPCLPSGVIDLFCYWDKQVAGFG